MYVTLGRRTCRVDAALPRPVSVYQLQKGLDSVRSLDDRGLDHLVTGLRALGGMDGRRFVLRLTDLHVSEYLIYDGKKLSTRRDEVESPVLGLSLEVTHSSPWGWGALVDVVATERRAREASVLTVKSFGVPYELQLDGSSIDLFLAESSNWFSVPVSWDYFEYEQGIELPYFLRESERVYPRVSAFWRVVYHYQIEHKTLRLSPQPTEFYKSSSLHWLRDGVIVKEERLPGPQSPFSLELYVDATDCASDLGGLELRRTEQFLAKRNWVNQLLKDIALAVRRRQDELSDIPGPVLGGWNTLVLTTTYLPIAGSVKYKESGPVADLMNQHPGLRKNLLKAIKTSDCRFQHLELGSL